MDDMITEYLWYNFLNSTSLVQFIEDTEHERVCVWGEYGVFKPNFQPLHAHKTMHNKYHIEYDPKLKINYAGQKAIACRKQFCYFWHQGNTFSILDTSVMFVENVGQMLRQARAKGGGEWKKSERALEHSL